MSSMRPVTCQCVGKHVPLPTVLHRHHVIPKYLGGTDASDNLITICPTTHNSVHGLLRQYARFKGLPPGRIRKHYSQYVQDLAERGWSGAVEGIDRRASIQAAVDEDSVDLVDEDR